MHGVHLFRGRNYRHPKLSHLWTGGSEVRRNACVTVENAAWNNAMNSPVRPVASWRLRTRTVKLGGRTLIMGVVNITPDSFSDGGLFLDPQAAVAHGLRLLQEGADLLDLGAESTRPGSMWARTPVEWPVRHWLQR